jgi:hypothetical protein
VKKLASSHHPLMLFSNFNQILKNAQRRGTGKRRDARGIKDFENCTSNMHAVDLCNGSYNWYSHDATSYIDRVFVDVEWLNYFNYIKVWGLDRSTSNHCPFLIGCDLD